jgi:CheY-like chemotaxis protein
VLIADDHVGLRAMIADALRSNGYHVDEVGNGRLALDAIRRGDHRVAIIDVRMPVMDGLAVAARVRTEGLACRVIVISVMRARPRRRYPDSMHEDDTLSRFEHSEPFTGRIEPLDGYVLVEPVDDETETNAGLIIPASAESACIAGIVVAAGDDASGVAPGDKVLYPRGAGFEIRIGGQPKRLLDRQELIARLYD